MRRFEEGGAEAFGGKGQMAQKRLADYEAPQWACDWNTWYIWFDIINSNQLPKMDMSWFQKVVSTTTVVGHAWDKPLGCGMVEASSPRFGQRCTFQAYRDVSDLAFRKNPQLRIDMQAEVPVQLGPETFESFED